MTKGITAKEASISVKGVAAAKVLVVSKAAPAIKNIAKPVEKAVSIRGRPLWTRKMWR